MSGVAIAALLLLASAQGHFRDPSSFRRVLVDHAVVPIGATRIVSRVVPLVEIILGATALVSLSVTPLRVIAGTAMASLYVCFTTYLAFVLRKPSEVKRECGCFSNGALLRRLDVLRGGILAALSASWAMWPSAGSPASSILLALLIGGFGTTLVLTSGTAGTEGGSVRKGMV